MGGAWTPFKEAARCNPGETWRGSVEIEGKTLPAWWAGASTAHVTCWVSDAETTVQHWRYDTRYDTEPEAWFERFPLGRFCEGAGRNIVVENFGAAAYDEILDQAKVHLNSGDQQVAPSAPASPSGSSVVPVLIAWLVILTGLSLLVWIAIQAVTDVADDVSVWWHVRVAEDMAGKPAQVIGHALQVNTHDGSWMHKNNPSSRRSTTYDVIPTLEVRYLVNEASLPQQGQGNVPGHFNSSKSAQTHLSDHYPIGARLTVYPLPRYPDQFLLSLAQAPTGLDIFKNILLHLLLFAFVYLPLVVLACMVLMWSLESLAKRFGLITQA